MNLLIYIKQKTKNNYRNTQYPEMLQPAVLKSLIYCEHQNVLDRIKFAILFDMINQFEKVLYPAYNKSSSNAVYANQKYNNSQDDKIDNITISELLKNRIQLVTFYFNFSHRATIEKFRSKAYLQLFKKIIIDPIYTEVVDLTHTTCRNKKQEMHLVFYQALLDLTEARLIKLFIYYFTKIEGQTLMEDINTLSNLNKNTAQKKLEMFKSRQIDDNALLTALHEKVSHLLYEHTYVYSDKSIAKLIESLKSDYFLALSIFFEDTLKNSFKKTQKNLTIQINIEEYNHTSKVVHNAGKNYNSLIAQLAYNVLNEILNIEKSNISLKNNSKQKKCYAYMSEALYKVTRSLQMIDRVAAGKGLCKYQQHAYGHASNKLRLVGGIMILTGVLLILVGILTGCTTLVPTFGSSIVAGTGIAVSGFSLATTGFGFFYYGRKKSISHAIDTLGKTLQKSNLPVLVS